MMAPAGFSFEGKVREDGSIADALPISEIKAKTKGGYHEKKTVSWRFTASDPCETVYWRLIQDLAWAQAFADTKLQDFYDSNARKKTIQPLFPAVAMGAAIPEAKPK